MIPKNDFLITYNISENDFNKSECVYEDLEKIYDDFKKKFQRYDDAGANLVRILLRFNCVHSVKYRVKDPEHLIEKIVRKKVKSPKVQINVDNYQEKIQDLIGIRILHLFKSDWESIHQSLLDNFKQVIKPEANIRKGDDDAVFKEHGCKIKHHPAGYRSVHYLIKTEPTVETYVAEIQVRTIFEEAWSEIDHKIRYPYFQGNELVNHFLKIFNRLAGSADEMGDFASILKAEIIRNDQNMKEVGLLKDELDKTSLKQEDKIKLNQVINNLNFEPMNVKISDALIEAVKQQQKSFSALTGSQAVSIVNALNAAASAFPLVKRKIKD